MLIYNKKYLRLVFTTSYISFLDKKFLLLWSSPKYSPVNDINSKIKTGQQLGEIRYLLAFLHIFKNMIWKNQYFIFREQDVCIVKIFYIYQEILKNLLINSGYAIQKAI